MNPVVLPSIFNPADAPKVVNVDNSRYAARRGAPAVSKTGIIIGVVVLVLVILAGIAAAIAIPLSMRAISAADATTTTPGSTGITAIRAATDTTTTRPTGATGTTPTRDTTPTPTVPIILPANCGRPVVPPITTKIFGGKEAAPHSWPWMALLRIYSTPTSPVPLGSCDGVLVANQWVITAAHCTSIARKIEVLLGVHNSTVVAEVDVTSTNIFTHPSYGAYYLNDIAAIKLPIPVTFTNNIQPACLPSSGETVDPGNEYYVAGWGRTTQEGNVSQVLMQAQFPVRPDSQCQSEYSDFYAESQLCASWPQGGPAPCNGDSGGPVVKQQADGSWLVVGLVSYSQGCELVAPHVLTDVSYFRSWLDTVFVK